MNDITLQRGSTNPLRAFVDEARRAQAEALSGPPRLIFAVDATASRKPTWDLACQLQGQMFQAAAAVGELSVQLAYFRGEEFRTSAFVPRADMLTRLMSEIICKSAGIPRSAGFSRMCSGRRAGRRSRRSSMSVTPAEEPASVLIRRGRRSRRA